MYTEPIILPLHADGKLYAVQDAQGRIVGTGTRDICEVLLTIMRNEVFNLRRTALDDVEATTNARSNLTGLR